MAYIDCLYQCTVAIPPPPPLPGFAHFLPFQTEKRKA